MKIRRIIALILTAVILMPCVGICVTAESNKVEHLGDLNYDNKCNLLDVSILLKYIAGWDMGDLDDRDDFLSRCDVNLDDKINLNDASYYLRWYASIWEDGYPYLDWEEVQKHSTTRPK